MTADEQLIELVKGYPVLYNLNSSQYRDHTSRNNAWEEIAEQMNTQVEDVKTKWGKLRNCFTNALKRRRRRSGQTATNIAPWKFETQMEFLLPHLKGQTVTNLGDDDLTQDFELQLPDEFALSPPIIRSPSPMASDARASTPNSTATFTQDIKQKRAVAEMDENDYFFLSMCKQLKKLPKTDQAEIKFQIHKLIHDSEMNMLHNREKILNTPIINSTGDKINQTKAENTMISGQTVHNSEKTILMLNTNEIMPNGNLTEHGNFDHFVSAKIENLESEAEQL